MEKIRELLDFSKLKYMFQVNIQNPTDLSNFLERFQNSLDSHDKTIKKLFLVQNEIFPFSFLYANEVDIGIIDEFLNGTIGLPKKSLYNYLFRVYNQYDDKYIISYKDYDNISSEVYRILTDADDGTLLTFYKDQGLIDWGKETGEGEEKIKSITKNELSEEFLYINDDLPKMITTDRILIHSALLNYSYSEIMSTTNYKNFISNKILPSNEIPSNWDNIRQIFIEFLKELSKRTINY